ncbi:MAG: TIGR00730 family Rossman fold protein [Gammaproteobacteria bacterium]
MNSVCVYCGSASGAHEDYLKLARDLGEELVRRELKLIYGGASIGLMGEVANTVLKAGGEVIGVLPHDLFRREVPHHGLTQLIEVNSMHERKAKMAELADGFIALPGGLGTLEELFEILTWAQLGLHDSPCGMLNVRGYFDSLNQFLDQSVREGFIRPHHRSMLMLDNSPGRLLDMFSSYQAPRVQKWIDLESS